MQYHRDRAALYFEALAELAQNSDSLQLLLIIVSAVIFRSSDQISMEIQRDNQREETRKIRKGVMVAKRIGHRWWMVKTLLGEVTKVGILSQEQSPENTLPMCICSYSQYKRGHTISGGDDAQRK